MNRYKIVIPKDNIWEVLNEFGMMGTGEFIHLSSHTTESEKRHHKMVRHCEEVLKHISLIMEFVQKRQEKIESPVKLDRYLKNLSTIIKSSGVEEKNYFGHIADKIKQYSSDINKHSGALDQMIVDLIKAEEEIMVSKTLSSPIPSNYT